MCRYYDDNRVFLFYGMFFLEVKKWNRVRWGGGPERRQIEGFRAEILVLVGHQKRRPTGWGTERREWECPYRRYSGKPEFVTV